MENIQDIYTQLKGVVEALVPKDSSSDLDGTTSQEPALLAKSQVVDTMEVLSFSLLLHCYMTFYIYMMTQPWISIFIYQAFVLGVSYSFLQYNFFSFLFHPFFKTHVRDIVIPQSAYMLFHYYFLTTNYPYVVMIPLNMMIYHMTNHYFHFVEHPESRKVRTFVNLLLYFVKYFLM